MVRDVVRFIGFRPQNLVLLPLAIIFVLLIAVLFTALGTAIASILEDLQGFQLIMNFLVMPTFLLSGALFPLQGLPKLMEIAARIDPLSYGIDGLRAALISQSDFGITTDILVLSVITALLLGIGSYLFEKIQV